MRKALKSRAEFVFVDAPYLAEGATAQDVVESGGSAGAEGRNWWKWTDLEPGTRPSRAASYKGWSASQDAIHAALEENWPIDGILGFSQGATATALFLAHASNSASSTSPAAIAAAGTDKLPKWAVLIGGFMPRDVSYAAVLNEAAPIQQRSLHVSGEKDELVPTERSIDLANCFEEKNRVVYRHGGAHMVPTCSGEFKKVMVEFLDEVKAVAAAARTNT
jgi:predicted esterase